MPIYDFKLWFIYQINYNVRHLHDVDICLENRYSVPFYNIIGANRISAVSNKILFNLLIYLHWIIRLVEDIRNSAFFSFASPDLTWRKPIFSEITCTKSIRPNLTFRKCAKNVYSIKCFSLLILLPKGFIQWTSTCMMRSS